MMGHLTAHYTGVPCTKAEVEILQQHYSIKLPEAYKQFLLQMGKGAGVYDVGSDWEYSWLLTMKAAADNMLLAEGLPSLSQNAFVFWMHQGYQFCFFYAGEEASDPKVYYFNECFSKAGVVDLSLNLTQLLAMPGLKYNIIDAALEGVEPNC